MSTAGPYLVLPSSNSGGLHAKSNNNKIIPGKKIEGKKMKHT
jgi:hypothetical protein